MSIIETTLMVTALLVSLVIMMVMVVGALTFMTMPALVGVAAHDGEWRDVRTYIKAWVISAPVTILTSWALVNDSAWLWGTT